MVDRDRDRAVVPYEAMDRVGERVVLLWRGGGGGEETSTMSSSCRIILDFADDATSFFRTKAGLEDLGRGDNLSALRCCGCSRANFRSANDRRMEATKPMGTPSRFHC